MQPVPKSGKNVQNLSAADRWESWLHADLNIIVFHPKNDLEQALHEENC